MQREFEVRICGHQFRPYIEEEIKGGYWTDWEDKKRASIEATRGAQSWRWMELILVRSSL
jgi:hypothetical protein